MTASKDEINLVIARLRVLPEDIQMTIGKSDPLNRNHLIEAVAKQDGIGKMVVRMQMRYLRSFKARLSTY